MHNKVVQYGEKAPSHDVARLRCYWQLYIRCDGDCIQAIGLGLGFGHWNSGADFKVRLVHNGLW